MYVGHISKTYALKFPTILMDYKLPLKDDWKASMASKTFEQFSDLR